MSKAKKIETELITGSYLYEQIRRGIMLGSEDAVIEFESLLQATLESMIRLTFRSDNDMVDYYAYDKYITMNRVGIGWLNIIKNILTEFGHAAQANLSGKLLQTNEAVVGASTNVRRFDIIDDEAAENPYKKHTLQLHPRTMGDIAHGAYSWENKAWEAWGSDEPITLGGAGDVQVSPIVEEQVTIYLWAISHVMDTDHLYRRYAIMQEKLERAIDAAKEQVAIYGDIVDTAVEKMAENKVRITKMAGNSIIELRQVIRSQKMVELGNERLTKSMDSGPLAKFEQIINKGDELLINILNVKSDIEKKERTIRGQLINFNQKYNRLEFLFKQAGIDITAVDDEYGINPPKMADRIKNKLGSPKAKIVADTPIAFPEDVPEVVNQ